MVRAKRAAMRHALRVLMVSNLFPPDVLGGYELLAADVAKDLRARGHDLQVLTSGEPRRDDPAWVHRQLSLVRPFGEAPSLDRVRHLFAGREQQRATRALLDASAPFDVALIFSLRRLGLHAPRVLAERGLPAVYCFNDDWLLGHRPGEAATPLRRALFGLIERGPLAARTWTGAPVRHAVYVSTATREALRAGGAPVPEGVVRFQGVDRALFVPRPPRPVAPGPRLLFVGRVHPTKGCDLAIDALAALRAEGREATLSVAGTGDVAELDRLRAHAAALGVGEAVRWLGFVPRGELPALYQEHDVFCFPSRWDEPAGLTYLEAMSSGIPVVALARGGARELLVDGENSLLADDGASMAAGVARLIADPALCQRVVEGGFSTLSSRASLGGYVDAIEDELAAASSARSPLGVSA